MEVRVSKHAAEQARLRLRQQYQEAGSVGSVSQWLKGLAEEALERGRPTALGRRAWRRIIWVFDEREDPVVLVTVIVPDHRRGGRFGRTRVALLTDRAEKQLERAARLARGDDL